MTSYIEVNFGFYVNSQNQIIKKKIIPLFKYLWALLSLALFGTRCVMLFLVIKAYLSLQVSYGTAEV